MSTDVIVSHSLFLLKSTSSSLTIHTHTHTHTPNHSHTLTLTRSHSLSHTHSRVSIHTCVRLCLSHTSWVYADGLCACAFLRMLLDLQRERTWKMGPIKRKEDLEDVSHAPRMGFRGVSGERTCRGAVVTTVPDWFPALLRDLSEV